MCYTFNCTQGENVKKQKKVKKGSIFYRALKSVAKIFFKKPEFIYLDTKPDKSCLILCNHVGVKGPLNLEFYFDNTFNFRFWGTHEMADGLRSTYKYQTEIYFHQKRGWNLIIAKLFCIIAAPIATLFYKGLRIIPTYQDARLKTTLKTTLEEIKNGKNIVIFPENSNDGYHDVLTEFHPGFTLVCKQCQKIGIDVPIYVAYYNKYNRTFVFDKPIKYSELVNQGLDKTEMCNLLCKRANELKDYVKPN